MSKSLLQFAFLNMLYAYLVRLSQPYLDILKGLTTSPWFLKSSVAPPNEELVPPILEKWYYPAEIANDLQDYDLPERSKEEAYACTWEYTRCVIPQYTNWTRYVAFMRVIIIGIIAECKGDLTEVALTDNFLGQTLTAILADLFQGTPGHADMAREFRCFLLLTAEKSSKRRDGLLFRRYVTALAKSPRQWFRMRDTDALIRFTIGAALACNDLDDFWYTDEQFEALDELGATLYDSVAFFKHRSEGETNSTFAYVPLNTRIKAFHQCRELLWALDVAWAGKPEHLVIINFLRFFGGPIHMMMRRYRFVEDGMMIGLPETATVIKQARQNIKLWNRVDVQNSDVNDVRRYNELVARSNELMFDGLSEFLNTGDEKTCEGCQHRDTYGAGTSFAFGGVMLCDGCRESWGAYVESFPDRLADVFPEIKNVMTG